jgi:hypothetical protein
MCQQWVPVEQLPDLVNLSCLVASSGEGGAILLVEPRAASGHEGLRQSGDVPLTVTPLPSYDAPEGWCLVAVDDPVHGYELPILDTLHEDPDESVGNEGPVLSPGVGVTLWDLGGRPCPSSEPPLANHQEHI